MSTACKQKFLLVLRATAHGLAREKASKLLVVLRVDGTHQSYLVLSPKRADLVHGYHPVLRHIEYVHYSCAIEEKKILHSTRCHRSARLNYALLISIFLH